MPAQSGEVLTGLPIPDADDAILGSRDEHRLLGAEVKRADHAAMADEITDVCAFVGVVEDDCAVLDADGKDLAVGAEGDSEGELRADLHRAKFFARVGFPRFDDAGPAYTGELATIGAEGDGGAAVRMAGERADRLACSGVPQADLAPCIEQAARRCQSLAVGTEGERLDEIVMPG